MDDNKKSGVSSPAISLPTGGGAISGIGETFQPDLFTGTGNFSVPIFTSPGRQGFGPELALQYSTGSGNGPFGLGWQLSIPRITRKTEKGLPEYDDGDVFVLSGAEDLVVKTKDGAPDIESRSYDGRSYNVTRYLPRIEGLFARIEKWDMRDANGDISDVFWRVTTKDNVTSLYGRTEAARIQSPHDVGDMRVFEWLLEETFDAKGNHILYEYAQDYPELKIHALREAHREYRQKYLRRIFYGNLPDRFLSSNDFSDTKRTGSERKQPLNTVERKYAFEVLFDYGDLSVPSADTPSYQHYAIKTDQGQETFIEEEATSDPDHGRTVAPVRADAFSSFRPGFELRTLRRCERVLMVHHFPELGGATLVKSTELAYQENEHTRVSFLTAVKLVGYRKEADQYISREMPPVEFSYSEFRPTEQQYQSIDADGSEYPPVSLRDPNTTLVDMFGNGMPDIVQSCGWRIRNLAEKPAI